MLIVVAIIAILIAISIPLVQNALERTKHATDSANERAAKAVILLAQLDNETISGSVFETKKVYYYDAKEGKLASSIGTGDTALTAYGQHKDHAKAYIAIGMGDDGTVTMRWVSDESVTTLTDLEDLTDGKPCSEQKDVQHTTS